MKKIIFLLLPVLILLIAYTGYSIWVGYKVRNVVVICNEARGEFTDELKGRINPDLVSSLYFQDYEPVSESEKILNISFPIIRFKSFTKAETKIYYTSNYSHNIPVDIKMKKLNGKWKIVYVFVPPY